MTTGTDGDAPPNGNGIDDDMRPVDVESIRDTVTTALKEIPLSAEERSRIEVTTANLIGHLNLLLAEELGHDTDQVVRGLYRAAYKLLDLSRRPTLTATTFGVWEYMRDMAGITKRFLDVWVELHEDGDVDG